MPAASSRIFDFAIGNIKIAIDLLSICDNIHRKFTMKEKTLPLTIKDHVEPCCSLDIDGNEQTRLVEIFKALGHPARFEILKYLLTHPGCITGDIVKDMPLAQATISQHLKVLREAGLIEKEAVGTSTCYSLNPETITWLKGTTGRIF